MDQSQQTPSIEIPFKHELVRPLTQRVICQHCDVEIQKISYANHVDTTEVNGKHFLFLRERDFEGKWIQLDKNVNYEIIPQYINTHFILRYKVLLRWCIHAQEVSLHYRKYHQGSEMELKILDTQNHVHCYRVDREYSYRILSKENS